MDKEVKKLVESRIKQINTDIEYYLGSKEGHKKAIKEADKHIDLLSKSKERYLLSLK